MKKTSNIVLIGMRGCGKSHFGSLLSLFFSMPKIDIDECIESMTQKTIPRIIEIEGWDAFREYEHVAIQRACSYQGVIISTGGGAITFERNRKLLEKNGFIVFLFASLSQLLKRLENDSNKRPNLTSNISLKEEVIEIWNARKKIYFESSDLIFWSQENLSAHLYENIFLNVKVLAKKIQEILLK